MSGANDLRWLAGAALLFLLLGVAFWEYRIDDTFIFLQYARNLATGHGPSFNADQPVYGFSSPLWMLLLAGLERLGLGTLTAAKVLAQLAALAALGGFLVFARQRLSHGWAWAATFAWAANAWMIRWSAAAMETALVVGLALWSLALWERERREPGRPPWAACCLGLLVLARPEGSLLVVLALGLTALDRSAGGLRRAALGGAVIGALVGPWLVYARLSMGCLLPVTGAAKGTVGLALEFDPLLDVARIVATTSGLEALLVLVGLGLWLARGRAAGGRRWELVAPHALPLLWLLALPAFYAATGFDVLSRYALPIVPVVVVYGFAAAADLSARLGSRTGRDAADGGTLRGGGWRPLGLALLIVALNAGVLARIVQPHTRSFSQGVITCFEGMGRWFAANTPADAEVAIADIGAFGYYSGRRVLDLAALVSPELIPLVDRYSIQEIASGLRFSALARPDYLIDRHTSPGRLAGRMQGVFEPLPIEPCAIAGLGVRSPQTIYYTAYRLRWDRYRPSAGEE